MTFVRSKEMKIDLTPEQAEMLSAKEDIKTVIRDNPYTVMAFDIFDGDALIGFVLVHRFEDRKYFLWDYGIDVSCQNRHLGTTALTEFIDLLKTEYHAREITTTYVYGNDHARRVYEKVGFVQTNVVDEPDCHEVNMVYFTIGAEAGRSKGLVHAEIVRDAGGDSSEKCVEVELADGQKAYLAEKEYSQEELAAFCSAKYDWIMRCAGSRFFLADSDSGEDAQAEYCRHFDLEPENAVFENGKFVGSYLCTGGVRYSGRGRYNYTIDEWGWPGDDPFGSISWSNKLHVFLFSHPESYEWGDWTLLEYDPEKDYETYLKF